MKNEMTKTALISGGTSGIGKAVVLQLLQEGYNVVTFSRSAEKVNALKEELSGRYEDERFLVMEGDVTDEGDITSVVDEVVKKFGAIDVLVNNAGIGYFTACDDIDVKKFQAMLNINLTGLVSLTAKVAPVMKKNKSGLIINISSTSGKRATPSQLYSATKFAVTGYSESIREELRLHNIKVTTVYPGMVMTDFFDVAEDWDERVEKWNGKIPTMLAAEDIARAISYVCSQPEHVLVEDLTAIPFRNE